MNSETSPNAEKPKSRLDDGTLNPEYSKWYRETHASEIKVAQRKWNQANKVERNAKLKEWRKTEEGRESTARWRQSDNAKQVAKRHRLKTREKAKSRAKLAKAVVKAIKDGVSDGWSVERIMLYHNLSMSVVLDVINAQSQPEPAAT